MSTEKKMKTVLGGEGNGGNIKYIRASELSENNVTGVVAEGIYEGTLPNRFDEAKSDFKVKSIDGGTLVLNHAGSLANQLNRVTPGSYVRISYSGKQPMKKGKMAGKLAHSFIVEVEMSEETA
jgi:hypothetical protein